MSRHIAISTTGEYLDEKDLEAMVEENPKEECSVCGHSMTTSSRVHHPPHYTWLKEKCGIEVIDITRHMDFCLGNSLKYILRAGHKTEEGMTDNEKTIEDLQKAIFYINDKIKTLENEL